MDARAPETGLVAYTGYAPAVIDYEAHGFTEYEARLARLIELLADLRPFWPLVVPLFVGWMGEQFKTEGGYFGEDWPELSADYADWKSQHYPGKGLLVAEGELKHEAQTPKRVATPTYLLLTIEPFTKRKGPGAGRRIDPEWFQIGTSTMPARPLLPAADAPLPLAATAELEEALDGYITEMVHRVGL